MPNVARAAVWVLSAAAAGCAHADLPVDYISRIVLSPDGAHAAMVVSGSGPTEQIVVTRVATRQTVLTLGTADFVSHIEPASIADVSWSADGAFLKIDVTDGDMEHRVFTVRPSRPKSLAVVTAGGRHALAAEWAATGHDLFAVIAADEPENPPTGLFRVDPAGGAPRPIVTNRPVTAILAVSRDRLLLRVPTDVARKLPAAVLEVSLPSLAIKPFLEQK